MSGAPTTRKRKTEFHDPIRLHFARTQWGRKVNGRILRLCFKIVFGRPPWAHETRFMRGYWRKSGFGIRARAWRYLLNVNMTWQKKGYRREVRPEMHLFCPQCGYHARHDSYFKARPDDGGWRPPVKLWQGSKEPSGASADSILRPGGSPGDPRRQSGREIDGYPVEITRK